VLVYDLIKTPLGGGALPAPPDDARMRSALRDAVAGWDCSYGGEGVPRRGCTAVELQFTHSLHAHGFNP
jgi:hypothetical protein